MEQSERQTSPVRARLEFDLPEAENEHLLAVHGGTFYSTLWDIDQEMRSHLKYDGTRTADELAEWVREACAEVFQKVEQ